MSFSRLSLRPYFDLTLYLVANRPSFEDENLFFSKISDAVQGGVTCVQLRDHQSDPYTILKTATHLRNILKGTPLFINTLEPFQITQAVNADGVYLEEPFSYSKARSLLGPRAIIGVPVKTMEEVAAVAECREIDYLSVKIAPSKWTCPVNHQIWGLEGLQEVCAITPHRIVAIGGINLAWVESVYRELRFGDGIAMAGGLMCERDPYNTAAKIQAIRQGIGHD